jgi:hypothetical protein
MISRMGPVCKELVRFYPLLLFKNFIFKGWGHRGNRRFPLLPARSLSSMHHHRLWKLRRLSLK